jgi:FAD/FMN-containing dehydrogenase
MTLRPANLDELCVSLIAANSSGVKIAGIDLAALNRVIEHTAEDMTVTVEAGLTLAALQAQLALQRQWLPIDPPNPHATTISEILNANLSGPRRYGCGTIRDHLIGLRVLLADGRVIQCGGKVVKNVAGYDLQKLFVGSRGSLGVIVEATFKLRPVPETEQFVGARCELLEQADKLIETVMESQVTPVVLDLHNNSTLNSQFSTILGFAGTREEVEWQLARARELGFGEPANLDHEKCFWAEASSKYRLAVLPSRTIETIRGLAPWDKPSSSHRDKSGDHPTGRGDVSFVARAGNGVIYYRGGTPPPKAALPVNLLRRVKDTYDSKHIFPDLQL